MGAAAEKFEMGASFKITQLKSGVYLMLSSIYFKSIRKVMRGLEERLSYTDLKNEHDYINGVYVYKIENAEGHVLYVRFEPGWCYFGSKILY